MSHDTQAAFAHSRRDKLAAIVGLNECRLNSAATQPWKTRGLRFLRCLGFRQPKPRTRLGRLFRRSERTLIVLLLLYGGLQVFPQVLFAHSLSSFSGLVAHEIMHGLIRHELGWLRSARLPDWVAEGYCEYVAREGSFPEAEGLRLLAMGQRHPNSAFRYFLFRQMVTHLIDDGELSFAQVVARGHEGGAVEADTVEAIRRKYGP